MPLTKEQKQKQISDIKDKFSRAKAAVVVDYMGITVSEADAMRKELREAEVDYSVFKNTLGESSANPPCQATAIHRPSLHRSTPSNAINCPPDQEWCPRESMRLFPPPPRQATRRHPLRQSLGPPLCLVLHREFGDPEIGRAHV